MRGRVRRALRNGAGLLATRMPFNRVGDRIANLLRFYARQGYVPSLYPPRSFNCGLLAVKIWEADDPLRRRITDKEWVKDYIR